MNVKRKKADSRVIDSQERKRRITLYLRHAVILLFMGGLLYFGASWQIFQTYTDAAKYQCYVIAFWKGVSALKTLPATQCSFITHPNLSLPSISQSAIVHSMLQTGFPAFLVHFVQGQSSNVALHALPHEYPFLTLIPFSLGLVVSSHWYQIAFACWMDLIAILLYLVLLRFRSSRAAFACALYLVVGGWATTTGRFDIIPSTLTLIALICAYRSRWSSAFALLAVATLFKFYPLVLLPPFLLAQQSASYDHWYAWRRWLPLATFVAICVIVTGISLLFSVEGTLGPLSYFGSRPVQVESLAASILWLLSLLSHNSLHYAFTFGSLNVLSPLSSTVGSITSVLLVMGLLYTFWLQWRGKIDLAMSSLLFLLVVITGGKVFSPQYLIWIIPLMAYVGESDLRWMVPWSVIGGLTTLIYPVLYLQAHRLIDAPGVPSFLPAIAVRNLLLVAFILYLLISRSRNSAKKC